MADLCVRVHSSEGNKTQQRTAASLGGTKGKQNWRTVATLETSRLSDVWVCSAMLELFCGHNAQNTNTLDRRQV